MLEKLTKMFRSPKEAKPVVFPVAEPIAVPAPVTVPETIPEPSSPPAPEVALLGRDIVARHYLKGEGIEVGALHNPLKVPTNLKVRYVDRMSETDLRHQYPELHELPLVHVDVLDDGETLATFSDQSQDFVIANHFLEHSQDPIGTIKNMMRVLKPGGALYLTVPEKRFTFDRERPITTLQHLLDDHRNGPAASRMDHLTEFVRFVSLAPEPEIQAEVKRLFDMDYSIHYHVWDKRALSEFLHAMQDELDFDLVFSMQIWDEVLNVLIKRGIPPKKPGV